MSVLQQTAAKLRSEAEADQQVFDAAEAVAALLEALDAACLPPDVRAAAERAAEALIALYPEES